MGSCKFYFLLLILTVSLHAAKPPSLEETSRKERKKDSGFRSMVLKFGSIVSRIVSMASKFGSKSAQIIDKTLQTTSNFVNVYNFFKEIQELLNDSEEKDKVQTYEQTRKKTQMKNNEL